jgi:hypothetical protein
MAKLKIKLSFKLVFIVVLNYGNKGLSLPLAIAEILSLNQMDHDKSDLCESLIYARDSATPPFFSMSFTKVLTCASTSQEF